MLARSTLYHSDILSMYPSRFGLTLRQAYHLAGLLGFNRSSVIVSTTLNRHCCMEVNLYSVGFPLIIRPLVGCRYVGSGEEATSNLDR